MTLWLSWESTALSKLEDTATQLYFIVKQGISDAGFLVNICGQFFVALHTIFCFCIWMSFFLLLHLDVFLYGKLYGELYKSREVALPTEPGLVLCGGPDAWSVSVVMTLQIEAELV